MSSVEEHARRTIHAWADSIEVDTPAAAPADYVRTRPERRLHERRRQALVAVAAAVVVVIASVAVARATWPSHTVTTPFGDDSSTSTTVMDPSLGGSFEGSIAPLAEFMQRGTSGGATYEQALQRRIGVCMNALGWDYPPADHDPSAGSEPNDVEGLLEYRRTYGYGLLNGAAGSSPALERYQTMLDSLSPGQKEQFFQDVGTSAFDEGGTRVREASGCTAEAEPELARHFPSDDPTLVGEVSQASAATRQDPRYLEAADAWRACMSDAGFDYSDPEGGRQEVGALYASARGNPTEEQRARERAVGTADATCASGTIWPATAAIETEVIGRLVEEFGHDATCGEVC